MTGEADSRRAIRELVESWAVWRDAGEWERLRTVWHDDGRMMATWFQGTADGFIEANKQGWARGVRILHFLGGSSVDVAGDRAVSQTKMTISQRAEVHGTLCDVVCTGRFYDFFERRQGRWGLVLRQPIYEKDRLDPVDPSASVTLDRPCSRASPRATATSPICRPRSATTSSATCRDSRAPRWSNSTRAEPTGSRAARRTELHGHKACRQIAAVARSAWPGAIRSSAPGGTISTGRCACWATPCETEPSSIDLNADSPRAPITIRHAS